MLPCQPDGYVENIDGAAGSKGKNTDDDVDGGAVADDDSGGGDPLLLLTPRLDRCVVYGTERADRLEWLYRSQFDMVLVFGAG